MPRLGSRVRVSFSALKIKQLQKCNCFFVVQICGKNRSPRTCGKVLHYKQSQFKTNEADGITVHFRLVDATTEQNNNKEADDKKRTFMLYTETEENPDLHTFEYDAENKELIIRFLYDIPANPKTKWHEVNMKAIRAWVTEEHPELIGELLRNVSTKSGEFLPIIEKHLKGYVAKNTFDYFIHKDLGGFLRRELDFFIKNEVMHIDDIDTESETRVESYLGKVRAIKRVGGVIIDFLAQVEDFQKRLWLKKKFVVETNYCITLDKIKEEHYAEIAANEAQVKEWIEMYAINEIKADAVTIGFSLPLSIDFLKQNKNLIVDTRHFDSSFRDKLLASIDNLDEQINGVMMNADNFHALNNLQEKYSKSISTIYIDPPYNTNASEILYKNGYKNSCWNSLINDRLTLGKNLLCKEGFNIITIDYKELLDLGKIADYSFGEDNRVGLVTIFINPKGRQHEQFFASSTEYMYVYANDVRYGKFNTVTIDAEKAEQFSLSDENGKYRLDDFRRMRTSTLRINKPKGYYPIYVSSDLKSIQRSEISDGYCIYPVDESGREFTWKIIEEEFDEYNKKGLLVAVRENGKVYIRNKYYEQQVFHNIWTDKKYFPEFQGTNLLKDILGDNLFSYPKSIYAVEDSLKITLDKGGIALDYFAGSGTTGHAVINLNRADGGKRKYILVEMGEYFSKVTQPRIKKVIYSAEWKDGKPKNRTSGVSHIMKYMRLESYEDALSNIELKKTSGISLFGEDYLINYMLNMESRDSLLSIDKFRSPFEYKMRITEKNECRERQVDVCETFNHLIGLSVCSQSRTAYFSAEKSSTPAYEGAVELKNDDGGVYGFRQIEGTLPDGRRALVIWRTITGDTLASNAALDAYFSKYRINPADREYDIIYVNGDNNLENLHTDEDRWKVEMIEKVFNEKMWEA